MNDVLQRSYRIEIWVMQARNVWKCEKVASPGNLTQIEDQLFANSDRSLIPVILAIKVAVKNNERVVGVAFTNASSYREIGISEFIDNDIYSNLEALLIQLSVKEIILPLDAKNTEFQTVKSLLTRCDIIFSEVKPSEFGLSSFEQDIDRLLKDSIPIRQKGNFDSFYECS
jgi:DNA mismatch repair protein MSH2